MIEVRPLDAALPVGHAKRHVLTGVRQELETAVDHWG
jgi:hypothetical protein